MSNKHEFIMPFICKWEGGLSNDKNDSASIHPCPVAHNGINGFHTNMGITWPVWVLYCNAKGITIIEIQADRFFKITKAEQSDVFKVLYWDKVKGDEYTHTAIANCMASWAWGSGNGGALKQACKFTGAKDWSGVVAKLNSRTDTIKLFSELCEARAAFFVSISQPGSKNAKFQKGWLNRLAAFKKFNEPLFI